MAEQSGGRWFAPSKGVASSVLRGRKILYYTDARHFGGHEVASLHALKWMLFSGARVCFVSREQNHQLSDCLCELKRQHPSLDTIHLTVPRLKYPDLSGLLYRQYLGRLRARFKEAAPDLVFVSQGNLAISWAGLYTARELNIPCLSYIPMAQPLSELLGGKARFRGAFSRQVIHWPNAWLTSTGAQEKRLRQAGARQPIDILPNPILMPPARSREHARAANQVPSDVRLIGMAGRLNNRQKGCDLFVEALSMASPESPLKTAWLLFIGDGEARETMQKTLEKAGWAGRMRFTGWTDAPWEHYAALDLLVMPSRFEGQPLAMQEALLCHVPVCGTRVEGLADYLPEEWLSPPGDASKLRDRLETMLLNIDKQGARLAAATERVRVENNLSTFGLRLESAFEALASRSRSPETAIEEA